jgi:dipeptidyl aminopeptidase/acylaminoacyl peptidase
LVNLTEGLDASFVDLEDDHTVPQKPPFGIGGWVEGDEAVLLYDKHDVWLVSPDGSEAERITDGADDNLRYRRVRLDPDEDAIDPDAPQYFALYDDWEELWGYGRARRMGAEVEPLILEEARVYGLIKAEEAEVYGYRLESFERSPNLYVGGPGLQGPVRVTDTNPFQDDYAWGRAELVEFTNSWGDELQGSLFYPANYEPGRQYPMIVYIYEIRSNAVRGYQYPSETNNYNFQTWIQNGYFVFQPDIVYRDRDPGVSAMATLEPAVQTMLETGMIDPDGVGLVGHSWGGYQTTFAVTQTDIFSAAVAGAPLTNLFSMYLSVYWNSGGTDARIFEISQGRMEVPFWEDEDAYRRNSPVFHIENMNTPFLMAQGTEDGAVDFNQGVEFYNAARRAGKDFVFLVYNGENHGLSNESNQKDYHGRINEWFGHYLKGEPAPPWITEGLDYLEQQEFARPSLSGGR